MNDSNNAISFKNTIKYDIVIDNNQEKYGIIGLVSNWIKSTTIPNNKLIYENINNSIVKAVQYFNTLNITQIIAITHCELIDDNLIAFFPEIKLILSGHDHIYYNNNKIIKSGYDFNGYSKIIYVIRYFRFRTCEYDSYDDFYKFMVNIMNYYRKTYKKYFYKLLNQYKSKLQKFNKACNEINLYDKN